jgi:hypothetical protein
MEQNKQATCKRNDDTNLDIAKTLASHTQSTVVGGVEGSYSVLICFSLLKCDTLDVKKVAPFCFTYTSH